MLGVAYLYPFEPKLQLRPPERAGVSTIVEVSLCREGENVAVFRRDNPGEMTL